MRTTLVKGAHDADCIITSCHPLLCAARCFRSTIGSTSASRASDPTSTPCPSQAHKPQSRLSTSGSLADEAASFAHALPAWSKRSYRHESIRFRVNMYRMKEEREIAPETFCHLVSSTLYEKRFGPYFIEPVIAGLPAVSEQNPNPKPYIACTDLFVSLCLPLGIRALGSSTSRSALRRHRSC
jgi:hypothetical protein